MSTDDLVEAFRRHDAVEYDEESGEARVTTTPFEASARGAVVDGDPVVAVTVMVPTLSAAVEGEVGDAVEEGWFDTLALRVEDSYDVTRRAEGEYAVERDGDEVRVTFEFPAAGARSVDDAVALVNYVEGTYVQGVVPGYDYVDPVAGLLSAARQRGQGDEVD